MEIKMNEKKGLQKRSIITKNKILDTAKALFCEKGFYNVTTNEIAKKADIAIGTLYHHFDDRDAILCELLNRHNEYFKTIFESGGPTSGEAIKELKENPRKWIEGLIKTLISLHENDLPFVKELNALYYNHTEVRKQKDEHTLTFQRQTYEFLLYYKDDMKTKDLEALSIVIYGFITSLIDQAVLYPCPIEKERYLETGVKALVGIIEELFR